MFRVLLTTQLVASTVHATNAMKQMAPPGHSFAYPRRGMRILVKNKRDGKWSPAYFKGTLRGEYRVGVEYDDQPGQTSCVRTDHISFCGHRFPRAGDPIKVAYNGNLCHATLKGKDPKNRRNAVGVEYADCPGKTFGVKKDDVYMLGHAFPMLGQRIQVKQSDGEMCHATFKGTSKGQRDFVYVQYDDQPDPTLAKKATVYVYRHPFPHPGQRIEVAYRKDGKMHMFPATFKESEPKGKRGFVGVQYDGRPGRYAVHKNDVYIHVPPANALVREPSHEPAQNAPVREPSHEPAQNAPVREPSHEPAQNGPVRESRHEPAQRFPLRELMYESSQTSQRFPSREASTDQIRTKCEESDDMYNQEEKATVLDPRYGPLIQFPPHDPRAPRPMKHIISAATRNKYDAKLNDLLRRAGDLENVRDNLFEETFNFLTETYPEYDRVLGSAKTDGRILGFLYLALKEHPDIRDLEGLSTVVNVLICENPNP